MSSTSLLRKEFERFMIQNNDPYKFSGCLPEQIARFHSKTLASLECGAPMPLSAQGRRLNNFCLGSDPEFVFVKPGSVEKTSAAGLGLYPGLSCGCDQNQRLAELRGWPTVSVVEHVAGILASLRWMYRVYPDTRRFQWKAGAYYDGDGIGGHVHFGRKRPTRTEEVSALDGVATAFKELGILDPKGWDRRNQPDVRKQIYGQYGDFRIQKHGYEYRTMPSWLCSPRKAFVILTACKLAVLDPDLTQSWRGGGFDRVESLRRLATYYAGRDDDAWLLKNFLGGPERDKALASWTQVGKDFKLSWGFSPELRLEPEPSLILPAVIPPAKDETLEIAEHLLENKPLTFKITPPTFINQLPKGYYWLYSKGIQGLNLPGAGDVCHDLVASNNTPFYISFAKRTSISPALWKLLSPETRRAIEKLFPTFKVDFDIAGLGAVFEKITTGITGVQELRNILLKSGNFPLWTVNSVTESSIKEWAVYKRAFGESNKPLVAKVHDI
jgi:hypothetical protein